MALKKKKKKKKESKISSFPLLHWKQQLEMLLKVETFKIWGEIVAWKTHGRSIALTMFLVQTFRSINGSINLEIFSEWFYNQKCHKTFPQR